jgi:hypothetical protein
MIENDETIQRGSLLQVKSMLTYCVREGRCDGHWAAMIEEKYILRILNRLKVLANL